MIPLQNDLTDNLRLRVGARDPETARTLASRLELAGLVAGQTSAVDELLAPGACVAVVLADGWDERLRFALEGLVTGTPCPPGVVILAHDPLALSAGPLAFDVLPTHADPRDLASVVRRAARSWRDFADRWPLPARLPSPKDLDAIAGVLEQETGLSLRTVRRRPFREAVRRRVVGGLYPSSKGYAEAIRTRAGVRATEVDRLSALLAVNETHFWRHAGQFTTLMTRVLPAFRGQTVRIWSAGCATGEEPYSIVMACLETLGLSAAVEVVATDLHGPSLARARRAVYRPRSVRNLPAELRDRYLEPADEGVRVKETIRSRVRFERVNLAAPDLGEWVRRNGPFHVIFCRNTLMYFTPAAASRVVRELVAGLVEGGALFLGMSETLWPRLPDLSVVRAAGCFYYQKTAPSVPEPAEIPAPAVRSPSPEGLYRAGLALLDAERFEEAERVFNEILAGDPEDPRGHTGLAVLRANEGRESEADRHLRHALGHPGAVPEAHYLMGLLAERRGDDRAALHRYAEALERDPALAMARINRAWILHRTGRRSEALGEMEAGLTILRSEARVPLWMTGGMDRDALEELVTDTLAAWRREIRGAA